MKLWVQRGKHRVRIIPTAVRAGDIVFTPASDNSIVIGPLRVICDPLVYQNGYDIPVTTHDSAQQYFELVFRRNL